MAPKPPYSYLILGAGRQGVAAAYDLVCFGEAGRVVLADRDGDVARRAANRVNDLTKKDLAEASILEVTDRDTLTAALKGTDVALSAVPYYFNLGITQAAIEAGTSLCDMGGKTDIVMEQLDMNDAAREAGISIVPDCGMGPGLINTMAAYVIELLDEPEEVFIYDAGLPQEPEPPWNYVLTFHINGLTNEMDGDAVFLREGKIVHVPTLTEPEWVEVPPLGRLEADVTSGGTSTAPWTFQDRVRTYENKVMRYPGHYEWLRAFKTLGLFSEVPITVGEQQVVPRDVYHALLEPQIFEEVARDVGVVRVIGKGKKDGERTQVTIDVVDYFDPKTGFTAMERLTGWHCSVIMALQARGEVAPGANPIEIAAPPVRIMEGLRLRGIDHKITWGQ